MSNSASVNLISDPDQVVVRKCSADDDTHHGHISLDHHPDLFRSTARSKHKSTDKLPPEFQRKIDIIEPDDLDGEIIQAKPDEPSIASNLFSYLVYKPDSEEARVYADRKSMYLFSGQEALYAILSRTLKAIRWIEIVSWHNDTPAVQKYPVSYMTGLKITQGSEINIGFNFAATFEGQSMTIDHNQKTFKDSETTTTKKVSSSITVPAYTQLIPLHVARALDARRICFHVALVCIYLWFIT